MILPVLERIRGRVKLFERRMDWLLVLGVEDAGEASSWAAVT